MFLLPMKKSTAIFTLFFSLLSLGAGWLLYTSLYVSHSSPSQGERKLLVVATTGMIGDALRNIAGGKIDIKVLMGPGVDPHAYEATTQDGDALMRADLIFYNGLHLEGAMHTLFDRMAKKEASLTEADRKFIAVSDALDEADILVDPTLVISKDPHIWHDVLLWKKVVIYISNCLQQKDPQNADFYQKNRDIYLAELEALHQEIIRNITQIPSSHRILVTAHDAFGYLGNRYHIQVKALQGFSTAVEPGVGDRVSLKEFIIKNNIIVIFEETSVNNKKLDAVIESCLKEGHSVSASEKLYSDSLGDAKSKAATYIGMMRANIHIIIQSLPKKNESENTDTRNS